MSAIFIVLDAFCNSRTVMNTSATRCTQIISMDFDSSWQIASVCMQVCTFLSNSVPTLF
jgi:hypothetical protein